MAFTGASRPASARRLAVAGLSVGLLAVAGCDFRTSEAAGPVGDDSAEQSESEPVPDIDPVDMVNETDRLEVELGALERRILRDCMEGEGYTVHDEWQLAEPRVHERDTIADGDYETEFFQSMEKAETFGFGAWVNTGIADRPRWSDLAGQYKSWGFEDVGEEESEGGGEESAPQDNEEFQLLPDEDQYDWYSGFYGEEAAEALYGWMVQDGPVGPEHPDTFAPGGCTADMLDAVYGDDAPEEVNAWTFGSGKVYGIVFEHGVSSEAQDQRESVVAEAVDAEAGQFFSCVGEKGYPGWEFVNGAQLYPKAYWLEAVYADRTDVFEEYVGEISYPEPPEHLPSNLDEVVEAEIAMATAWADCNDRAGLKEAMVEAYTQFDIDYYKGRTREYLDYQDAILDAIETAEEAAS
ncbi:hypothetical protein [Salininema proteolyticum]|uniref:Uncharacterized protein n=1 Tax=Salininema proteolyticum TaxID=1607685 RepID=A0ABV8TZH1_9ACTN